MSALVAADIKKVLNIPFVVTFHALGIIRRLYQGSRDAFSPERINIEKRVVNEADHIIAECPQDEYDLINYYNADRNRISIIPCGFSSKEFFPIDKMKARVRLGFKPDEKILLQIGRIVERKGVDNVIRILGHLRKNNCDCKLVIVGGECDRESFEKNEEVCRLKSVAAAEGVTDHVLFTGRKSRTELKYYYSAADVFITTPWYEPFGITPLEAMACGTPVIGANVGGIKYSVANAKTGYLVPPKDPASGAEKAAIILYNQGLADQMRRNALDRVNTMFTWKKVCDQLSLLYNKIAGKKSVADEVKSCVSR
jgi:glycosyltransferase involved in cell wall biosynthesis